MKNIYIRELLNRKYVKNVVDIYDKGTCKVNKGKNKVCVGINNLIISALFNNTQISEENIEDISSYVVDGTSDNSIDVIAVISEYDGSKQVYFIQHTTSSEKCNQKISHSLAQMRAYSNGTQDERRQWAAGNKKLFHLVDRLVNDKSRVTYKYVFIADFKKSSIEKNTWAKIKSEKDSWLIDEETWNSFLITFFIKRKRVEALYNRKPRISVVHDGYSLINVGDDNETKIGWIRASEIVKNFKEFGKMLFEENVRYWLGDGKKVNSNIIETINSASEYKHFSKYNNGLTIITSKFEDRTSNKKPMLLWDAQIINGAQTTSSLSKIEKDRLEQINVPIKIIIVKSNKELMMNIAKYSNSQNTISIRDLFSNSEEQIKLQKYFLERNILLEIKREEFQTNVFSKKMKKYTNTKVAQFFISTYMSKPNNAKNNKRLIYDDGDKGYYSLIFKKHNREKIYITTMFEDFLENKLEIKQNDYFFLSYMNLIYKKCVIHDSLEDENIVSNILRGLNKEETKNQIMGLARFLREEYKTEDGPKSDREISIASTLDKSIEKYWNKIQRK